MIKHLNRTQQIGIGVLTCNAVVIGYALTNRPLSGPVLAVIFMGNVLYIGYGYGKSRPVEIKIVDERLIG